MTECTKHRDFTVRYGDRYPRCPVCVVLESARELRIEATGHWDDEGGEALFEVEMAIDEHVGKVESEIAWS